MNQSEMASSIVINRKQIWAGSIITGLITLAFGFSGFMKLKGGPEYAEGAALLGLPDSLRIQLAVLEFTCLAIYLIPRTSILGAILLTGYMGGAICTHLRVGDAFIIGPGNIFALDCQLYCVFRGDVPRMI